MPLILGTNSIKDTGFDVDNSLRFNDGSSDYLNLSLGTPSNRKIFTCSAWVKRASTGTYPIFWFGSDSDNWFMVKYESDSLRIESKSGGSTIIDVRTNALYRDFSAWYSVIISVDTSQGTASNRIKIYVNGVQETSLQTSTYPNQDTDLNVITTAEIGNQHTTQYFDGYMAEVVFVDGTAQANTDLGEFDEDSGIWKPKDVSGLTFGTNGFYLDFEDSSALGNDANGSNNFTVNNLTAVDQSTDTCTNNFATLNPLVPFHGGTFSEGNLKVAQGVSEYAGILSTIGFNTGKWYCEVKLVSGSSARIGIMGSPPTSTSTSPGNTADSYAYFSNGSVAYKYNNNSGSNYGNTFDNGDIIGIAVDLDNNKIYWSKNGTWQNSGNPESGATGTGSAYDLGTPLSGFYYFAISDQHDGSSSTLEANFGGTQTFTISSGNTDANGYGNMEYEIPSGYYVLNSKNLAEFG
tara:strand:- start:816 stop:2204 length:1389 start_codon:yes stop_codon:yes gene_type:complete